MSDNPSICQEDEKVEGENDGSPPTQRKIPNKHHEQKEGKETLGELYEGGRLPQRGQPHERSVHEIQLS